MTEDRIKKLSRELETLPCVVESNVWSDSISVRCSGRLDQLYCRIREHNLAILNIDGVVYFESGNCYSLDGEYLDTPGPASDFEAINGVTTACIVKKHDKKQLLVAVLGLSNPHRFRTQGRGWILREAQEAQIRLGPPNFGSSFLLDRHTHQLQEIDT